MLVQKRRNRIWHKAIAIILIQAFLCLDFAWAANGELIGSRVKGQGSSEKATLAPRLKLGNIYLQENYQAFVAVVAGFRDAGHTVAAKFGENLYLCAFSPENPPLFIGNQAITHFNSDCSLALIPQQELPKNIDIIGQKPVVKERSFARSFSAGISLIKEKLIKAIKSIIAILIKKLKPDAKLMDLNFSEEDVIRLRPENIINDLREDVRMHCILAARYTEKFLQCIKEINPALYEEIGGDTGAGLIIQGVLVHDIGRMLMPIDILNNEKPKLPRYLRSIILMHPEMGYDILKTFGLPEVVLDIALYHQVHANQQGGYPLGVFDRREKTLPQGAKIAAIIDTFEALTSHYRRYQKQPKTITEARKIMRKLKGKQLDAQLLDIFLSMNLRKIKFEVLQDLARKGIGDETHYCQIDSMREKVGQHYYGPVWKIVTRLVVTLLKGFFGENARFIAFIDNKSTLFVIPKGVRVNARMLRDLEQAHMPGGLERKELNVPTMTCYRTERGDMIYAFDIAKIFRLKGRIAALANKNIVTLYKELLRYDIYEKRFAQTYSERRVKSHEVKKNLFSLKEFQDAEIVMFYVPFGGEVETRMMMAAAFKAGKRVAVPFIEGSQMKVCEIESLEALRGNCAEKVQGIIEPKPEFRLPLDTSAVDLIVMPGVAFDRDCRRLGLGKGMYDRFLETLPHKKKIAIAYDFQVCDEIPHEGHDVVMDIIVTEDKVIYSPAHINMPDEYVFGPNTLGAAQRRMETNDDDMHSVISRFRDDIFEVTGDEEFADAWYKLMLDLAALKNDYGERVFEIEQVKEIAARSIEAREHGREYAGLLLRNLNEIYYGRLIQTAEDLVNDFFADMNDDDRANAAYTSMMQLIETQSERNLRIVGQDELKKIAEIIRLTYKTQTAHPQYAYAGLNAAVSESLTREELNAHLDIFMGNCRNMRDAKIEDLLANADTYFMQDSIVRAYEHVDMALSLAANSALRRDAAFNNAREIYAAVIQDIDRLLESNPEILYAHKCRATLFCLIGDYRSALQAVRKIQTITDELSIKVSADFIKDLQNIDDLCRGFEHLAAGEWEDAAAVFSNKLEGLDSIPERNTLRIMAAKYRSIAFFKLESGMGANYLIKDKDENLARAHYYLGRAYYESGRLQDAKEEMGYACKYDPDFVDAKKILTDIEREIDAHDKGATDTDSEPGDFKLPDEGFEGPGSPPANSRDFIAHRLKTAGIDDENIRLVIAAIDDKEGMIISRILEIILAAAGNNLVATKEHLISALIKYLFLLENEKVAEIILISSRNDPMATAVMLTELDMALNNNLFKDYTDAALKIIRAGVKANVYLTGRYLIPEIGRNLDLLSDDRIVEIICAGAGKNPLDMKNGMIPLSLGVEKYPELFNNENAVKIITAGVKRYPEKALQHLIFALLKAPNVYSTDLMTNVVCAYLAIAHPREAAYEFIPAIAEISPEEERVILEVVLSPAYALALPYFVCGAEDLERELGGLDEDEKAAILHKASLYIRNSLEREMVSFADIFSNNGKPSAMANFIITYTGQLAGASISRDGFDPASGGVNYYLEGCEQPFVANKAVQISKFGYILYGFFAGTDKWHYVGIEKTGNGQYSLLRGGDISNNIEQRQLADEFKEQAEENRKAETNCINNVDIDFNQLKELLFSLGYCKSVPDIIREFITVAWRIDFAYFRRQLVSTNPAQLQEVLLDLVRLMRDSDVKDVENPLEVTKLLATGLDDQDIFTVIDQAKIKEENARGLREILVSCAAVSQLFYIILKLIGINVQVAVTDEHVFNIIQLGDGKILFADFSLWVFRIIDITQYYEAQHGGFVLRRDSKISKRIIARLRQEIKRRVLDRSILTDVELLNVYYPYLDIGDDGARRPILDNLGHAYLKLQQLKKAKEMWQRSGAISPLEGPAFRNQYPNERYLVGKGKMLNAHREVKRAVNLINSRIRAANGNGQASKSIWDYHRNSQIIPEKIIKIVNEVIDREAEARFWTIIKDENSPEEEKKQAKELIVIKYKNILFYLCKRIIEPADPDFNDLYSEGYHELLKLIGTFDPGNGASFKTYISNELPKRLKRIARMLRFKITETDDKKIIRMFKLFHAIALLPEMVLLKAEITKQDVENYLAGYELVTSKQEAIKEFLEKKQAEKSGLSDKDILAALLASPEACLLVFDGRQSLYQSLFEEQSGEYNDMLDISLSDIYEEALLEYFSLKMSYSLDEIGCLWGALRRRHFTPDSYDGFENGDDESNSSIQGMAHNIQDTNHTEPYELYTSRQAMREIAKAIQVILRKLRGPVKPRYREKNYKRFCAIINMYYLGGYPLSEIGQILGVTESRVSQLVTKMNTITLDVNGQEWNIGHFFEWLMLFNEEHNCGIDVLRQRLGLNRRSIASIQKVSDAQLLEAIGILVKEREGKFSPLEVWAKIEKHYGIKIDKGSVNYRVKELIQSGLMPRQYWLRLGTEYEINDEQTLAAMEEIAEEQETGWIKQKDIVRKISSLFGETITVPALCRRLKSLRARGKIPPRLLERLRFKEEQAPEELSIAGANMQADAPNQEFASPYGIDREHALEKAGHEVVAGDSNGAEIVRQYSDGQDIQNNRRQRLLSYAGDLIIEIKKYWHDEAMISRAYTLMRGLIDARDIEGRWLIDEQGLDALCDALLAIGELNEAIADVLTGHMKACRSKEEVIRCLEGLKNLQVSGSAGNFDAQAEFAGALNQLRESLDMASTYLKLVADSFRQPQELEDALSCFYAAMELNPEFIRACANLVKVHLMTGDYHTAREFADKAVILGILEKEFDGMEADLELITLALECAKGLDYIVNEEHAKAAECFNAQIERVKENPAMLEMLKIYLVISEEGLDAGYKAHDLGFTDEHKKFALAYNNLGLALEKAGKIDLTIKAFTRAIEADKSFKTAQRKLEKIRNINAETTDILDNLSMDVWLLEKAKIEVNVSELVEQAI